MIRDLLAELARLQRLVDPVPDRVVAAAEAAGALLAVDRPDRLDLLADTVPLVRSAGARRLTFGPDPLVHLEIRGTGSTTSLVGLGPPGARLAVCWAAGGTAADLGESGYFQCLDVPAGEVRLVLTEPGRRPRATRWFHP